MKTIIIVLLAILVTSCAHDPRKLIVGTWFTPHNETFTIRDDGTISVSGSGLDLWKDTYDHMRYMVSNTIPYRFYIQMLPDSIYEPGKLIKFSEDGNRLIIDGDTLTRCKHKIKELDLAL